VSHHYSGSVSAFPCGEEHFSWLRTEIELYEKLGEALYRASRLQAGTTHASTWFSMNGYLLVISRLIPLALSSVEGEQSFSTACRILTLL
jgi:hypothetical protein